MAWHTSSKTLHYSAPSPCIADTCWLWPTFGSNFLFREHAVVIMAPIYSVKQKKDENINFLTNRKIYFESAAYNTS